MTRPALAIALGLALSPAVLLAQGAGPDVIGPVTPFVFDKDLRTLPTAQPGPEREIKDRRRPPVDPEWFRMPQPPDPVVQRTIPAVVGGPTPGVNFAGLAFTGARPPDTIGDVGLSHYIQMVNTNLSIFSKTGTLLDLERGRPGRGVRPPRQPLGGRAVPHRPQRHLRRGLPDG